MINRYFSNTEIATELGIDVGTVQDLIAGRGEWRTEDIERLLTRLAVKLSA